MRTIYLYVETNGILRKVALDMAYLSAHKKIRLLKNYFEDGLYLQYKSNSTGDLVEKYYLTKDKVTSEDNDHYFFKFPFKLDQVFDVAV